MDTLFFIASKVFWAAIKPETWLAVLLALAAWGVWSGRRRMARVGVALSLTFVLVVGFLPLGALLLRPLETQFPIRPPVKTVDGIVILGGGEAAAEAEAWGAPQFTDAAERFTAAMALARRFPTAEVVFTGGSGALRDLREEGTAQKTIAATFFDQQGLSPDRLMIENASRNTAENAALSLDVAQPEDGETWLLVTSAYHMPRAYRSFRRAGWPDVTPWPVDYRTPGALEWDLAGHLTDLTIALKEYVGLLAYDVTGR